MPFVVQGNDGCEIRYDTQGLKRIFDPGRISNTLIRFMSNMDANLPALCDCEVCVWQDSRRTRKGFHKRHT
jgi:hypothetical protein